MIEQSLGNPSIMRKRAPVRARAAVDSLEGVQSHVLDQVIECYYEASTGCA